MKKQYYLLTCLLFILANTKIIAQDGENYFGIKGGVSIPNLTAGGSVENPLNSGYSSRLGPDFAIFYERKITTAFSLQPELEYSSQGGKKNGFQAFPTPEEFAQFFPQDQVPLYLWANYNSEVKLNYLMLNALAKVGWSFGAESQCRFYVDAGPFAALLISAKQSASGSSIIYADEQMQLPITPSAQSFDSAVDIKSELQTGNFGITGNLGFSFDFNSSRIFLEAGGNYGFVNIQKESANGQNKTGAATIRIGYAYNF